MLFEERIHFYTLWRVRSCVYAHCSCHQLYLPEHGRQEPEKIKENGGMTMAMVPIPATAGSGLMAIMTEQQSAIILIIMGGC